MAFSIHGFSFHETPTELLALLLEDALIKREHPTFNVRQRKYGAYLYLRVTDDAYPACRVVDGQDSAGDRVFGPFGDRYAVENVIAFVCRHFLARSCKDSHPFRKCANLDLGLCAGPCRNRVSEEEYGRSIDLALDFLQGNDEWITRKIESAISGYSASGDCDKAEDQTRQLRFCRTFSARQRFIHDFETGVLHIRERGEQSWSYHFDRGCLASVTRLREDAGEAADIPAQLSGTETDRRFLLDRANVVYAWLVQNQASCSLETRELRPVAT
ncbi:MAG: hypothetical protein Q8R28_00260 [Dehalococcoidia bacterium]|nr:hypothetical protein [Dehalococcoidia bacterium]